MRTLVGTCSTGSDQSVAQPIRKFLGGSRFHTRWNSVVHQNIESPTLINIVRVNSFRLKV